MSRMGMEAQRRAHSPELKISPQGEETGVRVRPAWRSRRGWDFWAVRAFLLACTGAVSYTVKPFGLGGVQAAGVGVLMRWRFCLRNYDCAGRRWAGCWEARLARSWECLRRCL